MATTTAPGSACCIPTPPTSPTPEASQVASCLRIRFSLPVTPPNVSGIYGAQVVALDSASGAVIAGTIGGWSCSAAGPTNFDGGYQIQKLPIGGSYTVYAEPLDGAVSPSQIANAMQTLCRNATTDAGWPTQFSCVVPAVNTEFTVRTRPGP